MNDRLPATPGRIVFMGTPEFAVPSLEVLHAAGHAVVLAVSQPDRPRGRGRVVSPTPVRARASELGIPTRAMDKSTYSEGVDAVRDAKPDAIVVVAFGVILKSDLLGMAPFGCVNVHASLLPRHRGMSPIQAAILAGDDVTGVTTMRIDEGVDTGDILLQEETPLGPRETAGTLSARLAELGAQLLMRTMGRLFARTLHARPQDAARATPTRRIKKEHGLIDWTRSAVDVDRHIRAMTPWPSAFTFLRGRRVILLECEPAATPAAPALPGAIVTAEPLTIACGEGVILARTLRPEGGRAMTAAEFRAGHALAARDGFQSTPAR